MKSFRYESLDSHRIFVQASGRRDELYDFVCPHRFKIARLKYKTTARLRQLSVE